MKVLLIIACVIASLSPSWQSQKKSDRELDGLHGAVKRVRIETTMLDEEGKPDKEGAYFRRLTNYNSAGNKTEDESIYNFGKSSNGRFVYTYDDKGNRVEEAKYLNGSVAKTTYTYNDQGQLIKAVKNGGAFQTDSLYDSEGRLIETKSTSSSRFVFTYDQKGQLIKKQRFGGGLDFEEVKTYDAQGRVASLANGDNLKDNDYQKVTHTYDNQGNLIEEVGYSNKGKIGTNAYNDEFDSAGNWIKRIALLEFDRLFGRYKRTEVTYRTITYY